VLRDVFLCGRQHNQTYKKKRRVYMNISTQISTETLGNILKNFKLQEYFENDSLQAAIDQLLNDSETDIGITFQNIQEEDIERF